MAAFFDKLSAVEVVSSAALMLCHCLLSDENVDVILTIAVALKCEVAVGVTN